MGLVSPELSLDLKPSYVADSINGFLRQVSTIGDVSERLQKVDEFVTRLEDEMKKIEVFKRELPLCMLLLKDAIVVLKQESAQYKTRNAHQPVLEEFIPLKKESGGVVNTKVNKADDDEESCKDKKNWMSSVQLWSADNCPPAGTPNNCNQNLSQNLAPIESQKGDEIRHKLAGDDLHDPNKNRAGTRGFVPPMNMIHSYPSFPGLRRKVGDKGDVSVPGLSLLIPEIKNPREELIPSGLNSKLGGTGSRISNSGSPATNGHSNLRSGHQQSSSRKQRRCWSPELHRRFVDALTQLGGAQVATPKQIRELMRVDGLTNDEVKSHLQKYRLHTRRVPNNNNNNNNNSGASNNENGNNGVTGSWASQDQYSDSSKPSSSQSGSPQGPLHFPGLTGGTSTTGGDSMEEDEDDDKSESHSWKGQHVHRPGKDDV